MLMFFFPSFLGNGDEAIKWGGILGRNFSCVTHCHGRTSRHSSGTRDLIIEHPHSGFNVDPKNNAHHAYVDGPCH